MNQPCSKCGHSTIHHLDDPCTHYVERLKAECGCTGTLTPRQRELARHALGLPNKMKMSYRNRFVAGVGHQDYDEWLKMVAQENAAVRPGNTLPYGGDDLFWLTPQGARFALKKYERLDQEDFQSEGPSRIKNRLSDGPPLPRNL